MSENENRQKSISSKKNALAFYLDWRPTHVMQRVKNTTKPRLARCKLCGIGTIDPSDGLQKAWEVCERCLFQRGLGVVSD
jgi:hypothetical protein